MDKPNEPIHGLAEPIHALLSMPPFTGAWIHAGLRVALRSARLPVDLASRSRLKLPITRSVAGAAPCAAEGPARERVR